MRVTPLFVVVYVASVALVYPALTPEETRDFGRWAKQFHVMAFRDGKPAAATLATSAQRDPALRFLLPQAEVELHMGDLHKATVLDKGSDWQLVRYDYGNTISSVSVYRAFADRVEPVSFRVTFDPGLMIALVALALPAWLLAFIAAWAWRRFRTPKAT
jgi:hypothetical protein